MIFIILGIALVAGVIAAFSIGYTFAEKSGIIVMFLVLGVLITIMVMGLGGLVAGAACDPELVEVKEIEIIPYDDNYYAYTTNDSSLYLHFRSSDKYYIYKYDFKSPALKFIFWNPYRDIYEICIPADSINWTVFR